MCGQEWAEEALNPSAGRMWEITCNVRSQGVTMPKSMLRWIESSSQNSNMYCSLHGCSTLPLGRKLNSQPFERLVSKEQKLWSGHVLKEAWQVLTQPAIKVCTNNATEVVLCICGLRSAQLGGKHQKKAKGWRSTSNPKLSRKTQVGRVSRLKRQGTEGHWCP